MKFYIETYGCSYNKADSEAMAGLLKIRHEQVFSPEEAEVIIINTCIVKKPTYNKMLRRMKELSAHRKKLVIAGCLPEVYLKKVEEIVADAFVVGPKHIDKIVEIIEEGGKFHGEGEEKSVCMPRLRENEYVGIIPIASGCLGNCSYCIVKHARGHLQSFPAEDIVKEAEAAISEGCKELWVTAQDTSAYGLDAETNLAELLERVCSIKGDFWIRVGMMNPGHALKILDQLVKAFKNEKVFKFLHLPVQSGNDEVLEKMHRKYTAEDFKRIVKTFRKEIPKLTLSTDVIVGFPGETDEQFEDTYNLIKNVKPDVLNISRFGAHKGTTAAEMEQHPEIVKKQRSRRMTSLAKRVGKHRNEKWVGWMGKVLMDEHGQGRNFAYKPIVLKEGNILGEFVKVEVENATSNYLIGKLV